jgi:amino acid transporter
MISTLGQLFCGLACLTSASRMAFAFSRDRGLPRALSKVNPSGTPRNAVIAMAVAALIITLPALKGNSAGDPFPFAFFAVVSITVIGLYIAYAIPIYLRWRAGSSFEQSPVWNLGNKWKWMNPFAVVWVGLITIIFCLPFVPAAVPGNEDFSWESVNYAPLTVGAVLLFATLAWHLKAKHFFTGQTKNIDIDRALTAEGDKPPSTS